LSLSKNTGLGSGIRKKPISNPGSRGQKGTESGSMIRIHNAVFKVQTFAIFNPTGSEKDPKLLNGSEQKDKNYESE
jgi:hypothetical protein